MSHKTTKSVALISLLAAAALSASAAAGQNTSAPPTVEEQLQAQYKTTKLGGDASGPVVIDPGTVLVTQKGGILGVPPQFTLLCAAKWQDGNFLPSGKVCAAMVKQNSRFLQTGEKVYATKIEVKPKNDRVTVKIIECDSCNGTNPPASFRGEVEFNFPKGFFDHPDVSKIEDAIGQVFTIDDSTADAANAPQAPAIDQPAQPAPAPAAPAQPVHIEIGQTIDQVVAAMGQPQKMVNLGAKKIYVYKDLKVTFVDGKVSDVQ